ncbi:helix-turn-helix domain-containing protein [Crassaminicella thermophila]|uniref:Stage 0 sporulation protein A homolog n=1 Tax=Crassaminicella thermophila TaxID=2599308 RepID=A0A5C0SET0_CRATE|nr:helix-turn-helix domain-containing protein [Crassaminicella thermophila]QEK11479.1 helix-turn-helix domain-containing protein [Crassaminicella thermophila]
MSMVLIVEDEILEQDFLKSVVLQELTKKDTLLTCQSGVEAIKLAKQYQPNIIIMDIMIPELDGLSAIEEIRKFLPNTSIIILSAWSDFQYAQKAINLQVLEYLLKPIKPAVFKQVFCKTLASITQSPVVEKTANQKTIEPRCRQYFIEESIKYINEHFTEKLTLQMVSSKIFMNPKYFSRIFKKEMGVSFSEYIMNLRIKHACKLLEKTNYPAYRIAIECGFSDASYFNRVFYSHMNMTPKSYRKYIHTSNFKN